MNRCNALLQVCVVVRYKPMFLQYVTKPVEKSSFWDAVNRSAGQ